MGGAEAPLVVSGTADVAGEPQPAAVELLVAVGADTTKFVDFFCIAAMLPMSFGHNDDTMLASSSCDRHTERYAPAIISSTSVRSVWGEGGAGGRDEGSADVGRAVATTTPEPAEA